MRQTIFDRWIYLRFLGTLLLVIATVTISNGQCSNWKITTKVDSSLCEASGRIIIKLTGADLTNLGSLRYSLQPLSGLGKVIDKTTSDTLADLPANTYVVTAEALCNGGAVSDTIHVIVPGNYQRMLQSVRADSAAFGTCKYGKMTMSVTGGRAPYSIRLTNYPAAYTGPLIFSGYQNDLSIRNLPSGHYDLSVVDACGSGDPLTVDIGAKPFSAEYFTISGDGMMKVVPGNCRAIIIPSITSDWYPSSFTYSFQLDGFPLTNAKTNGTADTLYLPANVSIKNLVGRTLNYYVKSPCGDEVRLQTTYRDLYAYISNTTNCDISTNVTYGLSTTGSYCPPFYVVLKNVESGREWKDTFNTYAIAPKVYDSIPYGSYLFSTYTSDTVFVTPTNLIKPGQGQDLYVISKESPGGYSGNDGALGFSIYKNYYENFDRGTIIRLISPSTYAFSQTFTENDYYASYETPPGTSEIRFPPTNYLFRITDNCATTDFPVTLTEDDAYHYSWSYTSHESCQGLVVIPTGTCTYHGANQTIYFSVRRNPDPNVPYVWGVRPGDSLILPLKGDYSIVASTAPGSGSEYVRPDGTSANTKFITYTPTILTTISDSTSGWVCPGAADNTGAIRIKAQGGRSHSGRFTYKLAEKGNGTTGPYLATNTTGWFSSNANYTLFKNKGYDVQITDDCGSTIVQGVTIYDYANMQVISTDKPYFCVGDTAYLSAIYLPTSAISYHWEGPHGFTTDGQHPILYNVDSSFVGTYKVTISTDICQQPIIGTFNMSVAPYTIRCYSAVTDTAVNPYLHGLLGNWRAARSYTWYGARAESDPEAPTNIRTDGAFNDFLSFWENQTQGWVPKYDTTKWVWNAESTITNKKGFELENKDPLGRFNAGLYGYDNAIPVAIVQNSRYQEAGFDGFEDYDFMSTACSDGACPVGRHFDFSRYKNKMVNTQHHTGRYSLRATPGDSIMFSAIVTDTDRALTAPDFQTAASNCADVSVSVLKGIRLNPGVLLPDFSPVAGKKFLFSIWVKEEEDCNCITYTNSNVMLFVGGPQRVTVTAKPKGAIIDGWQRYEEIIDVPAGSTTFSVVIAPSGNTNVYFDDIRIHPYNANMKSFVYDPQNLRLMAELDENNYATFYEYDDDGTLARLKKETERGVKTIKETRSALLKEDDK